MTALEETRVMLEIELCGRLADVGGALAQIAIPENGCSVAELFGLIAQQHPALAHPLVSGRVRACVNETIVTPDARVMAGDEVALFPPVSGG